MSPAVGREEPGDQVQRRGLAAAAGAKQRDELALRHGQIDAVDRDRRRRTAWSGPVSSSAGSATALLLEQEIADPDEAPKNRHQHERNDQRDNRQRGQSRREAEFEE